MKYVIVLLFIALTRATPLVNWGDVEEHQVRNWNLPSHEKLDWPTSQNWDWSTYQTFENEIPHQVAHQFYQGMIHDQLIRTHEVIKNLQRQLDQYQENWSEVNPHTPWSWTSQYQFERPEEHNDPEVTSNAIRYLVDDMQHQLHQWTGPTTEHEIEVAHQLKNTIEAVIEGHIALENIHQQQDIIGSSVTDGLHTGTFQTRVQELIHQYNEQEIEKEIDHHRHWAQQLHYQQQFVHQQVQQIEAHQQLIHQRTVSPHQHVQQLEQVHHKLQTNERDLIKQQLGHHLVVLQLQKVLVHLEQQMQQYTLAEHTHEYNEQGIQRNQPWSWHKSWAL